jgi:hypothetical protein
VALYRWRALNGSELAAGVCGAVVGWFASTMNHRERLLKVPAVTAAVAIVAVPYVKSLLSPLSPAGMRDSWKDGVCTQSTNATCGPSCAATLLRACGQDVDEATLAAEALTTAGGTECWYLARALRRRGLLVSFDLRQPQESCPVPAIAGVRFGNSGHFIAVLGR